MQNKNKLINVDLKFIIEQLGDNTFVCNNLPDRQVFISKDKNNYTYKTIFNVSGFTFDYSSANIGYINRPEFSILEKIDHDLKTCFFNYVSEEYPQKILMGITKDKVIDFGLECVDDLYYFIVSGYFLTKTGTTNIHARYIYDCSNDDLYVESYVIPSKFKDIFEMTKFTNSYVYFYESISTDGIIFDITYLRKFTGKDIIIRYLNNTLSIIFKDQERISFSGAYIVVDELKLIIAKVISKYPTDSLKNSLHRFNIDIKTLTIEELQTVMMAEI